MQSAHQIKHHLLINFVCRIGGFCLVAIVGVLKQAVSEDTWHEPFRFSAMLAFKSLKVKPPFGVWGVQILTISFWQKKQPTRKWAVIYNFTLWFPCRSWTWMSLYHLCPPQWLYRWPQATAYRQTRRWQVGGSLCPLWIHLWFSSYQVAHACQIYPPGNPSLLWKWKW